MERDDMAHPTGLVRRGNVWYLRLRVPTDLLPFFSPRKEFLVSLGTEEKREAIGRHRHQLAAFQVRFEQARELGAGGFERLSSDRIKRLVHEWLNSELANASPTTGGDPDADLAEVRDELGRLRSPDAEIYSPSVISTADKILLLAGTPTKPTKFGRPGPAVDRNGDNYRSLLVDVRRGLILLAEARESSLTGSQPRELGLWPHQVASPLPPLSVPAERTVADLIEGYTSTRSIKHGEASTIKRYSYVFRALEVVIGTEKPVSEIKRADCEKVQAFLAQLPSNASKKYPKLNAEEAIAAGARDGAATLAPNTVGTYLNALKAIFNWAVDEDWISKSPARRLAVTKRAMVKRRGYTPDELKTLFQALEPLRERHPAKFWVPALSLYTGARLNELCQLRVGNVIRVGEINCLDFTDFDASGRRVAGKHHKTEASQRVAPIHPRVIEAGFLSYLQERGGHADDQLFPQLKASKNGTYSHEMSKWFGRLKKKVGLDRPSLVFHSFRHGFRDACRRQEIAEETVKALAGWSNSDQASKYGDRAEVPNLDRAVRKLEFGEFDLIDYVSSGGRE